MCFGKAFHLILMHFFMIFQCFEERLHQILLFFRNSFFLQFRLIESVFRSIEIAFKKFQWASAWFNWSNLFFDQSNFMNKVFFLKKNSDLTCSSSFSNFPLSLWLGKAPLRIFCRFQPNFLQGFSLPRSKTFIPLLLLLFSWFHA